MQNIDQNALSTDELNTFGGAYRFFNWLQSIQDDLKSIPTVYRVTDCREVSGVRIFPSLPANKIGLLFLDSGTYEAAVVGGVDKWRRLYDGTTFDTGANLP